jgi:tryptophan halogenase
MPSVRHDPASAADIARDAAVVGDGILARSLRETLVARGCDVDTRVSPSPVEPAALREYARGAGLVICAVEDAPYERILNVSRACLAAGTPCLFVTVRADSIDVGPIAVPGATPCYACSRLALDLGAGGSGGTAALASLRAGAIGTQRRAAADTAVSLAAERAAAVLAPAGRPAGLATVQRIGAGRVREVRVPWHAGCDHCAGAGAGAERAGAPAVAALRQIAAADRVRALHASQLAPARSHSEYRTVAIVGGGTAGYLTALSLRAFRPELEVTVIESSRIPVIGVGEATTSELPVYLHKLLGLDVVEFWRRVQPTWKLGIRFEWGRGGDYHFNYPFDRGPIFEPHTYDGHIRNTSLLSALMDRGAGPVMELANGDVLSLLDDYPFAYHLENRRFVAYLQREALRAGVSHIDATIRDAVLGADGETVECLIGEDGRRLAYDLYVDCTGFRSELIEKRLGSRFISYADSLFTDTAVVAQVPHRSRIDPYTTAETMDAGWCWNIPQVEDNHRGYVFSSAFVDADQAADEMRANNPGMGDTWTVKFRSGRHEEFIKGNVVAIGNSYGFVEPLESTAIQVVLYENLLLAHYFPVFKHETKSKQLLNDRVAAHWDYLRWFLAVHYKFNGRADTPFWRACRADVDASGADDILGLFHESGPLTYRALSTRGLGGLSFNDYGFDVMLLGQGVVPERAQPPRLDRESYRRGVAAIREVADAALPHAEALELLMERRPDLLRAFASGDRGWVAAFARSLRSFA